jgi:hypothetical protein
MVEIRTIRYNDGRWCEREYVGDKLHGRWTVFYSTGEKEWERMHVNDLQEGYFRRWDEAGRLIEEMWFHLGELHGLWRKWDKRGVEEVVGDFFLGYPRKAFDATVNSEFNALIKPSYGLEPTDFATKLDSFLPSLRRRSLRMKKVTRGRLDRSNRGSFWNHVNVLGIGEKWPRHQEQPLFPILQINCDDIALSDNPLSEFSFITLFSVAGNAPRELGEDIVLRVYRRDEKLVQADLPCEPLDLPCALSLSDDVVSYPDENDLPPGMIAYIKESSDRENILDQDEKLLSRLGGWPGWIQSGRLSAFGKFAFQVDSLDIENWSCGDCAIHYFFRNADASGFSWVQEKC